jgi:pimeloyl-ACP methyl ester carboxylesterase
MITDLEAAQLCAAVYDGNSPAWDHWIEQDGIVAGIKKDANSTTVIFRGSANAEDWHRDLDEFPHEHPLLGYVHGGFLEGMEKFHQTLVPLLSGEVNIGGHSLGAAHACIFAGLIDGPVKKLALFGCPRPGFNRLRTLVSYKCQYISSFRNRDDPVTEVPFLMGLFQHVIEPTHVQSKTHPDIFAEDHRIRYYVEAMTPVDPPFAISGIRG